MGTRATVRPAAIWGGLLAAVLVLGPGACRGADLPTPLRPGSSSPAAASGAIPDDSTPGIAEAAAQTPATISLSPPTATVAVGRTTDVEVRIANAANLGAFEFTLTYNPALVAIQTAAVGEFLGSTGRSVGVPSPAPLINTAAGRVSFGAYSYGAPAGPGGSGLLARVTFRGVAAGSSPVAFSTEPAFAAEVTAPDGAVRALGRPDSTATITVR